MLAEGEEGQYTNIVVAQELQCVSTALMAALRDEAVPRGAGPSDWVNAVLVGGGWLGGFRLRPHAGRRGRFVWRADCSRLWASRLRLAWC